MKQGFGEVPSRLDPLTGKRVVVTRAEGQSVQLVAMLREAGAVPIVFPTISIARCFANKG